MIRISLGVGLLVTGVGIASVGACGSDSSSSGGAGAVDGGGTGGGGAGGTGGGGVDCQAVCSKLSSTGCPSADAQSVCEADCATFLSTCPSELQAAGNCIINNASLSCDSEGDNQIDGCNAQLQPFLGCTACTVVAGDDACETCAKNNCCAERKAAFADASLFDIIDCFEACTDAQCRQGCSTQYPSTFAVVQALNGCEANACPTECGTP